MTVKEYFEKELKYRKEKIAELTKLLGELPEELAKLEADLIYDIGYKWLVLSDKSHRDLGAKLATISGQTICFDSSNATQLVAQFHNVGPFTWIDLHRPKKGCRTIRVRTIPKERTITICGELPDNYEYLGEVEEE